MTRTATIRTDHVDPEAVAAAVGPDNTDEMTTRVDDGTVVTRIERESTSGLRSTVDDYVVNLDVAAAVCRAARVDPNDAPRTDPNDASLAERHPTNTDTNE